MKFRLLLVSLIAVLLAACGSPQTLPTAVSLVPPLESGGNPITLPDVVLGVVIQPAPAECGAEAAITFAQTQNDLALAALSIFEAAQANSLANAPQLGELAYQQAYSQLNGYAVPECLNPAKFAALNSFSLRVQAYQALNQNDTDGYQARLSESETARQDMVSELDIIFALEE